MTYPEPRYVGDGEVTARFRAADTPPDLPRPGGGAATYLATGASTDGRFGLYRWDMGPAPTGAKLIHFAPGAPREPYFEGLVAMAEGRWKPDPEELTAFFEEHDNFYV